MSRRLLIVCLTVLAVGAHAIEGDRVVWLENESLRVGVLPSVGGRIVWFGMKAQGNVLKAAPHFWNEPASDKPGMNEVEHYKAYHGNMVWPSPMGEWWTKQEVFPDHRKRRNRWPPDPYLIYGPNTVESRDATSLTWQSPISPVSGIQVTQRIVLLASHAMEYVVTFQNTTSVDLHWGIWVNTPLEGRARAFARVGSADRVRIKDRPNLPHELPWTVIDGYFTFQPGRAAPGSAKVYAKACLDEAAPFIAAFTNRQLLVIETVGVDRTRVHPDQSSVEIFNQVTPDPSEDLLELEFHSEYRRLAPGETMQVSQRWSVYSVGEPERDEERVALLNQLAPR